MISSSFFLRPKTYLCTYSSSTLKCARTFLFFPAWFFVFFVAWGCGCAGHEGRYGSVPAHQGQQRRPPRQPELRRSARRGWAGRKAGLLIGFNWKTCFLFYFFQNFIYKKNCFFRNSTCNKNVFFSFFSGI